MGGASTRELADRAKPPDKNKPGFRILAPLRTPGLGSAVSGPAGASAVRPAGGTGTGAAPVGVTPSCR